MTYHPDKHHRRSNRLKGFDYGSDGAYFLTVVAYNRRCLFGEIVNGEMRHSAAGKQAIKCWLAIPEHFPHVKVGEFVVMPNHIHGIIWIVSGVKDFSPLRNVDAAPFCSPSKTVGSIVRGFKIGVTKWFRKSSDVHTVWQRNYYDHIICDEEDLNRIRQYIRNNPARWALDSINPAQNSNL